MTRFLGTRYRKLKLGVLLCIGLPILLFLLLTLFIYLPFVQRYIGQRIEHAAAEALDAEVEIGSVKLDFPLDLAVNDVVVVHEADTLLHAQTLRLDVEFMPLFVGRVNVEGLKLEVSTINTKQLLSNVEIKGRLGSFSMQWADVNIPNREVDLSDAQLSDAQLDIALCDTAHVDTTHTITPWTIQLSKLALQRVGAHLALPIANIDSVGQQTPYAATYIDMATLEDVFLDLTHQHYLIRNINIEPAALAYLAKGPAGYVAVDSLAKWQPFRKDSIYDFSADTLVLRDMSLQVDSLSYAATEGLHMQIERLAFRERCGLLIDSCYGEVVVDSVALRLPNFQLRLPASVVGVQLYLPFDALQGVGEPINARVVASVDLHDLYPFIHSSVDSDRFKLLPDTLVQLSAAFSGNTNYMNCEEVRLFQPSVFNFLLTGDLAALTSDSMRANLQYSFEGFSGLNHTLWLLTQRGFTVPTYWNIKGSMDMRDQALQLHSSVYTPYGMAQVNADYVLGSEFYDVDVNTQHLALQSFVPSMSVSPLTASLHLHGRHFTPESNSTMLEASGHIDSLSFGQYDLSNTHVKSTLQERILLADLSIDNPMLSGNINLHHLLHAAPSGKLVASLSRLALHEAELTTDTVTVGGQVDASYRLSACGDTIVTDGTISGLYIYSNSLGFSSDDITYNFHTAPDTTSANLESGDLHLHMGCPRSVDGFALSSNNFFSLLQKQIGNHCFNFEALRNELPECNVLFDSGKNNPLSDFLHLCGYQYRTASLHLNSVPQQGIEGEFLADSIYNGTFLLDDARLTLHQDTSGLSFNVLLSNTHKTNPHRFRLNAEGQLMSAAAVLNFNFLDNKGVQSVNIGAHAQWLSDGFKISLTPEYPIIAYRKFKINTDNYIFLGDKKRIKTHINLLADDGTGLKAYSTPVDSVNDITISLNHVNLGELSELIPALPTMSGFLSGDMHVLDNHLTLSAMGDMNVKNFVLEDAPMGNVDFGLTYLPSGEDLHTANFIFSTNDMQVLSADGSYNDRTGALSVDGTLNDFPLSLFNGFLAETDLALAGTSKGDIHVRQHSEDFSIDGVLNLNKAHLMSEVYGLKFDISDQPLKIEHSRLAFSDFKLFSGENSALAINGDINLSHPSNVQMDLKLSAQNFHLIHAPKTQKSVVFGNVYANYLGTVRGSVNNLSVRGQLEVLDRTDMTYILRDSPLTEQNRLEGLVDFVCFADSEVVVTPPIPESNFDLALGINIGNASHFHCYLSEDGSSYADLNGGGHLTLRFTQLGEMLLTGRITAEGGEMKYQLPIIPLRTFHIMPDSYVEFNGEVANPTLNIRAQEEMKVIVHENERQRAVNFAVGVHLTRPLDNMGLEFIIDAPEDLTMRNELAAMPPEQRSKVAVAMMATGMYIVDSKSGGTFRANNALNAFLQSEIQNIAGKALKSVDISLGVEEGRSLRGTQTTDYSFRFAKRLWNDRVRIIIGGRVSAGVEADNRAESIINNMSLEYRLGNGSTRFLRLFYDRNAQDALEGELINTGAGYSVRRGAEHFRELFIRRKRHTSKSSSLSHE